MSGRHRAEDLKRSARTTMCPSLLRVPREAGLPPIGSALVVLVALGVPVVGVFGREVPDPVAGWPALASPAEVAGQAPALFEVPDLPVADLPQATSAPVEPVAPPPVSTPTAPALPVPPVVASVAPPLELEPVVEVRRLVDAWAGRSERRRVERDERPDDGRDRERDEDDEDDGDRAGRHDGRDRDGHGRWHRRDRDGDRDGGRRGRDRDRDRDDDGGRDGRDQDDNGGRDRERGGRDHDDDSRDQR